MSDNANLGFLRTYGLGPCTVVITNNGKFLKDAPDLDGEQEDKAVYQKLCSSIDVFIPLDDSGNFRVVSFDPSSILELAEQIKQINVQTFVAPAEY